MGTGTKMGEPGLCRGKAPKPQTRSSSGLPTRSGAALCGACGSLCEARSKHSNPNNGDDDENEVDCTVGTGVGVCRASWTGVRPGEGRSRDRRLEGSGDASGLTGLSGGDSSP